MAIITTNANTVTGSITNTLGTLGKSIFNSTIGTFASSSTMDQVYKAMDKLTNSIETVDKVYDDEAVNGRLKTDDLFTILAGLDIKSSSDFMNKNREFMKRLMRLNKQEKEITLNAVGVDATGDSDIVKNEYVRHYNHVDGNDYYEDYVKTLPQNHQVGDETTILKLESNTNFNYGGIHNELYKVSQNLYADDENKGTFSNKWIVENQNSLLYKTKKLWNSKKINTIVSRFHTNPNKRPSLLDSATSKYGMSHGRNLLTKQAEKGYSTKYANGYDNPYCRVWTHHHQYDRLYKTIRPFSTVDDQSNYVDTISVRDFHKWEQFSDDKDNNSETKGKWGWKKDSNNGWEYSVLQNNGFVNITPKYVKGESTNIHTKQCMFSIENLAWRGYDPYSFEQALSYEQRGPLGGRIMWFPPYGIQFSETTSAQWNNNTFLGRGEDVYTYANTTRTGTLSFMMVVDHPSIIDYVTWTNENKNVTDTDLLRFFAGCGEGNGTGDGLRQYAKPTPLTDEYTQIHETAYAVQEITEVEETTPDEEKSVDKILCFYVFYPNNYSGTYDDGDGEQSKGKSLVEPIPYLLAGSGAQKSSSSIEEILKNIKDATDKESIDFYGDIAINSEGDDGWIGNGYEMKCNKGDGGGLGISGGIIVGTSRFQNVLNTKTKKRRYWKGLGGTNGINRGTTYTTGLKDPLTCKKWYYRIDGRYEYPQNQSEEKSHYYNQTLQNDEQYKDEKSYGLNYDISVLVEHMGDQISKSGDGSDGEYILNSNKDSEVFTLAEIAYVLYGNNGKTKIQEKLGFGNTDSNNRITRLKQILSADNIKNIKSITAAGYASAQGYVETNQKLGEHRAQTAAHWFIKQSKASVDSQNIGYEPSEGGSNIGTTSATDVTDGDWVKGDQNDINAKKWRYARVEVCFNTASSTSVATANNTEDTKDDDIYSDGFYYATKDSTPLKKDIIKQPVYNSGYNESFKVSSVEITKDGDTYQFKLNNGTAYIASNYQEVTPDTACLVLNDETAADCKHNLEKEFTWTYDENGTSKSCVLYDYGDVICYAENDIENYYYSSEYTGENNVESFTWNFVDPNPIVIQAKVSKDYQIISYLGSENTDLCAKSFSYDKSQRTITLTLYDNTKQTYEVVASSKEENGEYYFKLKNNTNGIYVSSTEETLNEKSKYISLKIDGKTNYYYTQKNGVESSGTQLSIFQNNTEIINVTNTSCTIAFDYNEKKEKGSLSESNKTTMYKTNCTITEEKGKKKYRVYVNENGKDIREFYITIEDTSKIKISANVRVYKNDEDKEGEMKEVYNKTLKNLKITDNGTVQSSSSSGTTTKKTRKRRKVNVSSDENISLQDDTPTTDNNGSEETKDGGTLDEQLVTGKGIKKYVGYSPTGVTGTYKGQTYEIYTDSKGKKWYRVTDPYAKVAKFISVDYAAEEDVTPIARYGDNKSDENRLRYDQEYHFFKVLKQTDPIVYGSLMDKLQYFDPAFHSMTPEGFNGRLTFLQQCMRQGNTVSASDGRHAKSANNLAFGRAPYCVLRLGDFYNQMIVIDNMSINYDPLYWDLNVEGIGVQPLIAHVQLSFKFIGGSDMSGPVRRLQNAMSFNYYANARLYDNRADRIERNWSDKTCGAIEHDEILENTQERLGNEINSLNNQLLKEKSLESIDKIAKEITQKDAELTHQRKKDKVYNPNNKVSAFYTTQMYK